MDRLRCLLAKSVIPCNERARWATTLRVGVSVWPVLGEGALLALLGAGPGRSGWPRPILLVELLVLCLRVRAARYVPLGPYRAARRRQSAARRSGQTERHGGSREPFSAPLAQQCPRAVT